MRFPRIKPIKTACSPISVWSQWGCAIGRVAALWLGSVFAHPSPRRQIPLLCCTGRWDSAVTHTGCSSAQSPALGQKITAALWAWGVALEQPGVLSQVTGDTGSSACCAPIMTVQAFCSLQSSQGISSHSPAVQRGKGCLFPWLSYDAIKVN